MVFSLGLIFMDCRGSLNFSLSSWDLFHLPFSSGELFLLSKKQYIKALTNYITQLNWIELESECEGQNEGGGDQSAKVKTRIKQLMDVSRTQTAISVVEEDLKLLQLKLRASMSAKCNLEDQIKKLEDHCNSLQSAKAGLQDECKTLSQKVDILNELYQQEEMALHRKLSQEEYERQERAKWLSAADEKAVLAAQEVKTYKLPLMRRKLMITGLLEMTQKMAMRQHEPVILKPMAGRPNTQNPPRRGSMDGPFPHPRWSSEASGKRFASRIVDAGYLFFLHWSDSKFIL